jgi:hypothetical protein
MIEQGTCNVRYNEFIKISNDEETVTLEFPVCGLQPQTVSTLIRNSRIFKTAVLPSQLPEQYYILDPRPDEVMRLLQHVERPEDVLQDGWSYHAARIADHLDLDSFVAGYG